jgi:hypothetical protein
LALLLGGGVPADERREDGGLKRLEGLSPEQVRNQLGPPQRVARQILYKRYLEQWVFDGPQPCRIEFDCQRGRSPRVVTVQPLSPAKP